MRWRIDFGERPWHPWFAWFPVRMSHHPQTHIRVWWDWVERRKENCQGWIITSYRLPESASSVNAGATPVISLKKSDGNGL